MPLISRGVPAYASSGAADRGNDAKYGEDWRSSGAMPQWLAYDLSSIPAAQRRRILVWWSNYGTYNYDGVATGEPGYNVPSSYTVEAHPQAGGDPPASGWVPLATVAGERYHSRQFLLDLAGYSWIRLHVTAIYGSPQNTDVSINLDVFDAANGAADSWIVYGDSIAASGLRNAPLAELATGTFAELVQAATGRFPAFEQGAWGGTNTAHGVAWIDTWLAAFPGRYVILAWGTNDAAGQTGVADFKARTLTMVDKISAAGKVPVLGTIPWARNATIQANAPRMNAAIEEIYAARPEVAHGPDLWAYFQANPHLISGDDLHPTSEGYAGYRRLWAETMIRNVYQMPAPTLAIPTPSPATVTGPRTPTAPDTAGRGAVVAASPSRPTRGSTSGTVSWAGGDWFLLGMNYPWHNYGSDFGSNAWGGFGVHNAATYAKVDADFAAMSRMGVRVVRWFVFTDGRAGITFDGAGLPTGVDRDALLDLDAALEIAERHNIYLNLVLLDFLWMRDAKIENGVQLGGRANVINTRAGQQALIANVFTPVFQRYATNPYVLSWEVMNEPEWALSDGGKVNGQIGQPSTLANFREFTRQVADAVHRHTRSYVTVGGASVKWLPNWIGLGLDYYQAHYYDWMQPHSADNAYAALANQFKLDRPLVVAEFPASGSKTADLQQFLDVFYANGYAGAWPWSFKAVDREGGPDAATFTAWSKAHETAVNIPPAGSRRR